jgi:hypothetical protein
MNTTNPRLPAYEIKNLNDLKWFRMLELSLVMNNAPNITP